MIGEHKLGKGEWTIHAYMFLCINVYMYVCIYLISIWRLY